MIVENLTSMQEFIPPLSRDTMLGILKPSVPGTSGEQSTYPAPFPSVSVQAQKTRDLLSRQPVFTRLGNLSACPPLVLSSAVSSSVASPQEHG